MGIRASLWYCDAVEEGAYDWFETAFMAGAFIAKKFNHNPTALAVEKANVAFTRIVGVEYQVAWPFTRVTPEVDGEFMSRWIGWFADILDGRLEYPSTMPETNPRGSWRNE